MGRGGVGQRNMRDNAGNMRKMGQTILSGKTPANVDLMIKLSDFRTILSTSI